MVSVSSLVGLSGCSALVGSLSAVCLLLPVSLKMVDLESMTDCSVLIDSLSVESSVAFV